MLIPKSQTHCGSFADPYVEHDLTIIVLDLILLKQGVYRHLLFNRGSKPRRFDESSEVSNESVKSASSGNQERAEVYAPRSTWG